MFWLLGFRVLAAVLGKKETRFELCHKSERCRCWTDTGRPRPMVDLYRDHASQVGPLPLHAERQLRRWGKDIGRLDWTSFGPDLTAPSGVDGSWIFGLSPSSRLNSFSPRIVQWRAPVGQLVPSRSESGRNSSTSRPGRSDDSFVGGGSGRRPWRAATSCGAAQRPGPGGRSRCGPGCLDVGSMLGEGRRRSSFIFFCCVK